MERGPGSYVTDKDGKNLRPNLKDPAMKARHEADKKLKSKGEEKTDEDKK